MPSPRLVLFGFSFLFICLASGYVDTVDADASIKTAKALWFEHQLGLPFENSGQSFAYQGLDGLYYTKMGLGTPLLYLPAVALADFLKFTGIRFDRLLEFFVSLVNPFLTALIAFFFFKIFSRVRSPRESLFLTMLVVMASLLLPYSKTCHRETLQALCLLGAFWFLEEKEKNSFLWAGAFLGFGIFTKLAFVVPALPLVTLGLLRARGIKQRAFFLLPLLIFCSLLSFYSYKTWGNFSFGYSHKVVTYDSTKWKMDLGIGIWSQWVWPYKGLLFYSPLLSGLLFFARKSFSTATLTAIFLSVLFQTLFYAKWMDPWGGQALGPRYLVVVLPLLLVLFRDFEMKRTVPAVLVITFGALSLLIQIPLTAVKLQQYYTMESRSPKSFKSPQWRVTPHLFVSKLAGKEEIYPLSTFRIKKEGFIDVRDVPSLQGLNFWWAHLLKQGLPK